MNKQSSKQSLPRIAIAGTSSGVGKTTLSLAIMAALARRGYAVQGFKVGPDFIDPGYYKMVTGRPGRNLDIWMIGRENTRALFERTAVPADISIVEGVMGLYDGKDGLIEGSTADVAKSIKSPVLLTIDCAKMGGSAGAIALGYLAYDRTAGIRGFLLNNVGSDRHEKMVKRAVEEATGLPVAGVIRRNEGVTLPERHLGLVTQAETAPAERYIDVLAGLAEDYIDLDGLLKIASSEPYTVEASRAVRDRETARPVRIGVACDKAFSFYYEDNFDLLREAGAELVFFSPLGDTALPEGVDGLYIGGGYPEVHAAGLSKNRAMALAVKNAVEEGMPVYAECGGLIYLSQEIEDFTGNVYMMSGALPIACKMKGRAILGYREVRVATDSIIAEKGAVLRGHEFHYSTIIKTGGDLGAAYDLPGAGNEGFVYNNTIASYIHLHFAGAPDVAERFIASCRRASRQ